MPAQSIRNHRHEPDAVFVRGEYLRPPGVLLTPSRADGRLATELKVRWQGVGLQQPSAREEGRLALRRDFRQHAMDARCYVPRLMTTPASAPVAWPFSIAIWPLISTQGMPFGAPSGFMIVELSSTRS